MGMRTLNYFHRDEKCGRRKEDDSERGRKSTCRIRRIVQKFHEMLINRIRKTSKKHKKNLFFNARVMKHMAKIIFTYSQLIHVYKREKERRFLSVSHTNTAKNILFDSLFHSHSHLESLPALENNEQEEEREMYEVWSLKKKMKKIIGA